MSAYQQQQPQQNDQVRQQYGGYDDQYDNEYQDQYNNQQGYDEYQNYGNTAYNYSSQGYDDNYTNQYENDINDNNNNNNTNNSPTGGQFVPQQPQMRDTQGELQVIWNKGMNQEQDLDMHDNDGLEGNHDGTFTTNSINLDNVANWTTDEVLVWIKCNLKMQILMII